MKKGTNERHDNKWTLDILFAFGFAAHLKIPAFLSKHTHKHMIACERSENSRKNIFFEHNRTRKITKLQNLLPHTEHIQQNDIQSFAWPGMTWLGSERFHTDQKPQTRKFTATMFPSNKIKIVSVYSNVIKKKKKKKLGVAC